jgi:hypothetical protein
MLTKTPKMFQSIFFKKIDIAIDIAIAIAIEIENFLI